MKFFFVPQLAIVTLVIAFAFAGYIAINQNGESLHCKASKDNQTILNNKTVLLLGNSLIHDYDWSIRGYNIQNCAQQGLTINKFLTYELEKQKFDPAYIVIAFGTVEAVRQKTAVGYEEKEFVENLGKLARLLQTRWPNSQYILTETPPVNNQIYQGGQIEPLLIKQINQDLVKHLKLPLAAWVDLKEILDMNRYGLTPGMTYDGVHLTDAAYQRWNDTLNNLIEDQMIWSNRDTSITLNQYSFLA